MTDQQAPERIWVSFDRRNYGEDKHFTTREPRKRGIYEEYARLDLLEAAEKRIADLEENMRIGNESWSRLCEARSNALTKAEAERDKLAAEVERLTAERDQDLASVGAVIENLREYLVMKTGVSQETLIILGRAARELNSDATAALNEMLADAWAEGYDAACKDDCGANGYEPNPYRKEESNG